eukprot:TRINITY_DN49892_c0_g1_i1.p1 TRINITY_DN49892_c0_g1~~TRINITY_DN49892_c0_g1_i1.p1  ORF type:complete len:229 (-),score=23.50 TRINITY_DN49892_c0_g1_i1:52-738(-)
MVNVARSAGPRVQQVIGEELQHIVNSGSLGGSSSSSQLHRGAGKRLRNRVRRLIGEELESLLASENLASESAVPSRGGRCQSSSATSRRGTETPLRLVRDYQFGSSVPELPQIGPSELTRKYQYRRKESGVAFADSPEWYVEEGTRPIVPSKHKVLSKNMWASLNPGYLEYPEESGAKKAFTTPHVEEPVSRHFMNKKDAFGEYCKEIFKPGNQLVMRKGGGSMKKGA